MIKLLGQTQHSAVQHGQLQSHAFNNRKKNGIRPKGHPKIRWLDNVK